VHVVLCRSPRPRLIGRALASSADCPGALRPWPGGWPLPAAGGRRHHCGRRPTKPVFCSQSEDKGNRTWVKSDFLRLRRRYSASLLRSVATAAELPAFATANQRAAPRFRG